MKPSDEAEMKGASGICIDSASNDFLKHVGDEQMGREPSVVVCNVNANPPESSSISIPSLIVSPPSIAAHPTPFVDVTTDAVSGKAKPNFGAFQPLWRLPSRSAWSI